MVPEEEIKARLQSVRKAMRQAGLGGLFVSQPEDVAYLSGFTGSDSCLVLTTRRQVLLTDGRYTEEAVASAPLFPAELWKGNLFEHAGRILSRSRVRRAGFSASHLTVKAHKALKKGARKVRLSDEGDMLQSLRAVKSRWEINRIKKALHCAEAAFRALRKQLRPGMTEMEVRLELEWQMRRGGATDTAFETIVASGANSSRPHAHAGTRKVQPGKPLLIDFGARLKGYNSDLTRVLFPDSISSWWRNLYGLVLKAQQKAIATIGPAISCSTPDQTARGVFAEEGREKEFGHSLGHGVGLAVHEAPRLSARSRTPLVPGHIVTVEPGLYYPKRGGIRIEDMILVTDSGATVLSTLEKDMDQVVF